MGNPGSKKQTRGIRPRFLALVSGAVILIVGAVVTLCGRSTASSTSLSQLVGKGDAAGFNVLLVTLDTTRADYFSCYGKRPRTTPRMDDFAADSARYSRAFSTDFWTLPSHASILTGLYPSEAGATSETNHLPADVTTLAEHLKEAGYQTGAVVCNAWVSAERGFDQGFTDYVEMWRARNRPGPGASPARREQAPADQAVAWIERHAVGPAPFFLFINFNMAHLPYRPPSRFRARFQTGYCRPGQVEIMADLYAGEVAF